MATVVNAVLSSPTAGVLTTLYTVSAGYQFVGELVYSNTAAAATSIKTALTVGATTVYLESGYPLDAAGAPLSAGRHSVRLAAGTVVKVQAAAAGCDFTLMGVLEAI